MKILLTGATGFLGIHLLAEFLSQNYQVLIAKRVDSNMSMIQQRFGKLEAWDIEGDALEKIFYLHPNIDVIVHAATDYGRDNPKSTSTFWSNVVFPVRLLEYAIQYKISLFVNIDTFFNSNTNTYDYLGAYTLSKRHFQEWGHCSANEGLINFSNLRLFHLYGPGDSPQKFVPTMAKRCLACDVIDLTDGMHKRDFIHIDDAVTAVSAVIRAELSGKQGYSHYDVGTGTSIRVRDFMELLNHACGNGAKLNFGALPTRKGEFLDSCADIRSLQMLGWEARVGIEAGIYSVVADMASRNISEHKSEVKLK